MIEQSQKPSWMLLYGVLTFLILLAAGLLYVFITSSIKLYSGISLLTSSITFDKGAFYLPGCEIGFGVLLFVIIYEIALGKELTKKIARSCTQIGIIALIAVFSLPPIAQYMVEKIMHKHNYELCEPASHQWLFSKTIVYVNNSAVCNKLLGSKRR